MKFSSSLKQPAGEVRGFVHKKIGGAIVGGVKGFVRGGPAGVIGGAVGGFIGGGAPAATVCPPGFNPSPSGGCVAAVGRVPGIRGTLQRTIPGGATGFEIRAPGQLTPHQRLRQQTDISRHGFSNQFPIEQFPLHGGTMNGSGGPVGVGQAVVGRFGAGMEPMVRQTSVRDCDRGMVLAVDGLCYNRRDLRNSERFWPRGRRPLLTGGEMRAISTAASAARKLQRKQKDLQELGLLPKPTARRRKGAVAGHKATLQHA